MADLAHGLYHFSDSLSLDYLLHSHGSHLHSHGSHVPVPEGARPPAPAAHEHQGAGHEKPSADVHEHRSAASHGHPTLSDGRDSTFADHRDSTFADHRHPTFAEHGHTASVHGHRHARHAAANRLDSSSLSPEAAPSSHEFHEHTRAVDALLEAAGDAGVSDIGPPTSPDRGLDNHLPSAPTHLTSSIVRPGDAAANHAGSPLVTARSPDPPPPRA
ncbi:MAG: hypothetical protein ACOC8K_06940 [Gemmatimonadota bacterium]